MSPFGLSGILTIITSVPVGFLVLLKGQNKKISWAWFRFSLLAFIWGIGVYWISQCRSIESSLLAWKCVFAFGVIWMPPLFFEFVSVFCGINQVKTLRFFYAVAIISTILVFTPYLFASTRLLFNSLYFPVPGIFHVPFVLWWAGSIIYSHFILLKVSKRTTVQKKKQIQYFFLATALGFSGGVTVFLPHYGMLLYPWGNFTVFLYPIIMSFAILKYNLLDIRFIIRRTALLIGVYLILLILVLPVLYFSHHSQMKGNVYQYLLEVSFVSGILSTGPFLYAYMIKRTVYFHESTVAGLTHELKSPLAAIEGALMMLQEIKSADTMNEKQLGSYLEMIERNSSRLSLFVNNFLSTIKDRNDISLKVREIDLVELINKVLEDYSDLIQQKKAQISFSFEGGNYGLNGDPEKLELVISNLIGNALKFSNGGVIEIIINKKNEFLFFSIQDNGIGIPKPELDRVFERFFQSSNAKGYKGSGLGLTVSKLWVEAHGGRIGAESEGVGKGAKFWVELPS